MLVLAEVEEEAAEEAEQEAERLSVTSLLSWVWTPAVKASFFFLFLL